MKLGVRFTWIGLLAALFLMLAACAPGVAPGPTPAAVGPPIKIASINSTTGVLAFSGYRGHHGATMAVEEINKAGGVLGRPLELTIMDDKTDPAEGVKLFREAVAAGAIASIGPFASAVAPAVSEAAKELKTPAFFPGAWSRFIIEEAGHRYTFRIATNDRVFAEATAEELAKKPFTRYCTIAWDFAYGRDITATTMAALKKKKPAVAVLPGCEFWVKFGDSEFTPYITAIMGKEPEVVMFGGLVAEGVRAFIKQANRFGLFAKAHAVHPSLGMPLNNWGMAKEDVIEGMLTGAGYPYPPVDTPVNKQFFDQFRSRFNDFPMETSVESYIAVKTLAKAIEKAGTVDKEKIIDALEGMTVELLTGPKVTIRPFDHQSTQGWWMGELTWNDQYGQPAMKKAHYVAGDPYLPSQEEIQRLRAAKK